MKVSASLISFAAVGMVGFAVDAGMLLLTLEALGYYWGRLVSFSLAVLVTWMLNRKFTFAGKSSGMTNTKEFFIYLVLMTLGGGINFVVYVASIICFQMVQKYPVFGVALGSLGGLLANFTSTKFFLYKKESTR